MLLRYGLLGVVCQLLFWLALFALAMQFLMAIWPVVLVVLVLVVGLLTWRWRRKRRTRG